MAQPDKNDTTLMIRLPTELKDRLQRAAFMNDRKISAEVNLRLRNSLLADESVSARSLSGSGPTVVNEQRAAYLAGLNEAERALLDLIRAMSPEKQGALLTVLRR
jgi:hypothetical protein